MSNNGYFTAYDKEGNLIQYRSLSEISDDKRSMAVLERLHREEGDNEFVERLNKCRRKEAMQQK